MKTMANQFQTIINHFNNLGNAAIFTSVDFKVALAAQEIKASTIGSFLTTAYRMGVVEKETISGSGRAKLNYMKERSLTKDEVKKLTTYPICIDFKNEIDAAYKLKMNREAATPPKKAKHKKETVSVRAHSRKTRSKQTVSVTDHSDKTVITIYK
jgi:hypothetical protein